MVPDFVIIIPTYNEEKTIEETLHYIKKQRTQASVRVVVVDGGSTDRTVEIANKNVKVLQSPKKGKAYQLNFAASQTNSKFLIFLDADTHLPFNYVERVHHEFQKDSELWACGGPIMYTGRRFGVWHTFVVIQAMIDFPSFAFFNYIWVLLQRLPNAHYKIRQVNFFYNLSMFLYYTIRQVFRFTEFTGSNICIRRKIFEKIGGFRQPPKLGVDMLFSTILRKYIQKERRGKMKIIHSLFVETDVRHLATVRSLKRLIQHRI
ncbi:MAG: glycosyltransferase [Candidatus Helarchaeota archaeon]|nr:glycosyltransferase [Candidatus Helarchaeota archaeon]